MRTRILSLLPVALALACASMPSPGSGASGSLLRVRSPQGADLRALASCESTIIGILPAGSVVEEIARDAGWILVDAKGLGSGWIHATLLSMDAAEGPSKTPVVEAALPCPRPTPHASGPHSRGVPSLASPSGSTAPPPSLRDLGDGPVPARDVLPNGQHPRSDLGGYGYVVFTRPPSREEPRDMRLCRAFVELLPPADAFSDLDSGSVMVTFWPVRGRVGSDPSSRPSAFGNEDPAKTCAELLDAYDHPFAIRIARAVARLQSDGPMLVAWKRPFGDEGTARSSEPPDKQEEALVLDLAGFALEDIDRAIRVWRDRFSRERKIWEGGFDIVIAREYFRNSLQRYGRDVMSIASVVTPSTALAADAPPASEPIASNARAAGPPLPERLGDPQPSRPERSGSASSSGEPSAGIEAYREGNRFFDDRDWIAAIRMYRRALDLDPRLAAAQFNLGLSHARAGEAAEARMAFDRACQLGEPLACPLAGNRESPPP